MIAKTSSHPLPDLSLVDLPGPDTSTKLSAAQTLDPRLRLMLLEAARVAWPEAFCNDLYLHDAQTLLIYPGETMLWILRDHGTHLYPLECETEGQARYARTVIAYWSRDHKLNMADKPSDRARYYLVSDSKLKEVSANEAMSQVTVQER